MIFPGQATLGVRSANIDEERNHHGYNADPSQFNVTRQRSRIGLRCLLARPRNSRLKETRCTSGGAQ